MEGKVSIVTGASRGIGRAIATLLGANGGRVVVNYQGREDAAKETAQLIEAAGGEAIVERADVSAAEDAKRLVDVAVAAFGRVDILVNNAGIARDGLLMRMKDEDWDDVLNTNLRGAFYMTRQVARPMMKQRDGRIINITSVSGIMGNAGQVNYSSAKAGMIGLTKASAKELAARNITVNAVAPGYITTEMTEVLGDDVTKHMLSAVPLGRPGTPEDVAAVVEFLASNAAQYITGQVLNVDGGMVM
ncbi:3-oxoacyl-[acyl-carrier-protein] reductase [Alicyclobacillus fastidiosus]|uniref:3-oxoacyl-[acyl-carrier-protein] reductase n=1 Tax=Alicyclobacillus fastidiosus TaxID=392011 RepID=A0ABV5AGY4_9BACL|nr:3-oxoacyl-[acyl-carrier-protein] reductase [Alicyclobacillus fastidiosus]WEH08060.1 3-oxoacyl-[acyl-carrier-protein] reductase [Alicyclobacillus fastidiosus]